MDKRQKKKLYKQTLIKIRKLHPQKGDVICFQPDFDRLDIDIVLEYFRAYEKNKVFGEAILAIVPANIKKLKYKEYAQMYIDKLQGIVNQMEE